MKARKTIAIFLLLTFIFSFVSCQYEKNTNKTPDAEVEEEVVEVKPDKYSITYDTNGHGTTPAAVFDVTTLPSTLPTLVEYGWTFEGWYMDKELTLKAVAGATITSNTVLYAKWVEIITDNSEAILEQYKTERINQLDEYAEEYIALYPEIANDLLAVKTTGTENINIATSKDEVDTALSNAVKSMDDIVKEHVFVPETKAEYTFMDGVLYGDEKFVEKMKASAKREIESEEEIPADAIYVSLTGNDSAAGTKDAPLLTLQKALSKATTQIKNGGKGVILMREGTYSSTYFYSLAQGNEDEYVVVTNYPGETVKISGNETTGMFHLGTSNYLIIDGIIFCDNNGTGVAKVIQSNGGDVSHIMIKNCEFYNITVNTGPNDKANGPIINFRGNKTGSPINNIFIYNNYIHDVATGWSESITLVGNVMYGNVINNTLRNTGNIGIDIAGNWGDASGEEDQARYVVVRGNVVSECNSPYARSYGLYCDGARDVIFENNISFNSQGGIEIGSENIYKDHPVKNIIVRNNLVYGNTQKGIAVGGYNPAVAGIVYNVEIYNNTIVDNGDADGGQLSLAYVDGVKVFNNIFYVSDATKYQLLGGDLDTQYLINVKFDNNMFYAKNIAAEDAIFDLGNVKYQGLSAFAKVYGNGIYADPMFRDFAKNDFQLDTGSPALNTGIDGNETIYDLKLNPRTVGVIDIGCYEAQDESAIVQLLISNIENLGTITLNSKNQIEQLEKAYNSLSSEYKQQITNYSLLLEARETYDALIVAKLISDINSLPTVTEFNYQSVLEMCNEIEEKYNSLSNSQKVLINNIGICESKKQECISIQTSLIKNEFMSSYNSLPTDTSLLAEADLILVELLIDNYTSFTDQLKADLLNEYNRLVEYRTYIKENLVTKEVFMYESAGSKIEKNTEIYSGNAFSVMLIGGGATPTSTDSTSEDGTEFSACLLPGGSGRSYTITAKKSGTIYIYVTITDGSFASKTATVTYGNKTIDITSQKGVAYKLELEVVAGETYTVSASANRLGLFAIIYE